jgi:hypothetical protein
MVLQEIKKLHKGKIQEFLSFYILSIAWIVNCKKIKLEYEMRWACMKHEIKGVSSTNDIVAKNEASKASKNTLKLDTF